MICVVRLWFFVFLDGLWKFHSEKFIVVVVYWFSHDLGGSVFTVVLCGAGSL